MANFNISDLTAISSINDADIFEVEQGGVNKKVTGAQLKTYFSVGAIKWTDVAIGSTGLSALTGAAGTGPSGSILKGNLFRNTVAASGGTPLISPDGVTPVPKCFIIALQDAPTLVTHFDFITTMI